MENNAQGKAIYPSWYTKQVNETSTRVILTSIGGAILSIAFGVLALISTVWWMGVLDFIFAGCLLATGFMGAKKKNTTLLGIYSLICAVATIFGVVVWIIDLVVLIQVSAMSKDRFKYVYDGSQEHFIILVIVELVFYMLEIICWSAAICYTIKLRDLLLHPPQQQAVPIVYQPPQGGQQFVQTQPINQNPAAFDVENQYPAVPPPQY